MKQSSAAHIRTACQDWSVDVGNRYRSVTLVLYPAAVHAGKAGRGSKHLISQFVK